MGEFYPGFIRPTTRHHYPRTMGGGSGWRLALEAIGFGIVFRECPHGSGPHDLLRKVRTFSGHAQKGAATEVRVANVRKEFDRFPALHDVSLDIRSGELLALRGPSRQDDAVQADCHQRLATTPLW